MNRLMITMAACAMVATVNAASIKWQTTYEVGNASSSGTTAATMAYLVDSAILSQDNIYAALTADRTKTLAEVVSGKTLSSATMTSGMITTQTGVEYPAGYSVGDSVTAYMVLIDSNLDAVYFSETLTKTILQSQDSKFVYSSNSSIEAVAANMSGFDSSKGGWVAVPEPTSGLLLLLGMAGLALKRKRA